MPMNKIELKDALIASARDRLPSVALFAMVEAQGILGQVAAESDDPDLRQVGQQLIVQAEKLAAIARDARQAETAFIQAMKPPRPGL